MNLTLKEFTSTLSPSGAVWIDPAAVSAVVPCRGVTVERYLLVNINGLHVEIDDTPENWKQLKRGKRA